MQSYDFEKLLQFLSIKTGYFTIAWPKSVKQYRVRT